MVQELGTLTRRGERLRERVAVSAHSRRGGLQFGSLLFLLSSASLLAVRELNVSVWAVLSYLQQQLIVWGVWCLVDRFLPNRSLRFAWASIATLGATCVVLDGLLMRMTSLPLREILPMLLASQDVVEGLREIGLKPLRVVVLLSLLILAALSGGVVRLVLADLLTRTRERPLPAALGAAALVVLVGSFVSEQMLARDGDEYLFRGVRMPAYVQLYATTSSSVILPIAPPPSHDERAKWLAEIGPATNPRHVLYVLLESFRVDAVHPTVSPTIWQLAEQGRRYDNALAEATYTPLSWSVLFFDESAPDNLFGRHSGRHEYLGSWLLAVMRQAGYHPHLYVSTNLTYAKTRGRVLGAHPAGLDYFQAAADHGDDPADKNGNDKAVTDRLVKYIEEHRWDAAQPQFMMLQLDSTHYTYPFPEDHAVFKPFSKSLTLPVAIETQHEARLLRNRYMNAAHYVDSQLGRVIAALKEAGIYDETAVVLTADHGEGLAPGMQGHAAVMEATRHIPLIFKLPGEAPGRSRQLISHRDILPTLAEYLGIYLAPGTTRGRPASAGPSAGVLTIAPSGRFGQLTSASHVVDLRLLWRPDSLVATPTAAVQGSAGPDARQWVPVLATFLGKPTP